MFGEKSILGQSICTIDYKNRIILPKFTNAEEGDNLIVVDEIDFLSIYKEDTYMKKILLLEEKIKNSNSIDELRKNNLKLLLGYRTILKKVVCDKQHRINLGKIETDTNEIMCIGANDHLIIQAKKRRN